MATNKSSPHMENRHDLSCLLLADWKWLHPIVITFTSNNLFVPALQVNFLEKLPQLVLGSPPNFPKLTSQLWRIPQPQYFITLLLHPHWTYFWKQITNISTRLLKQSINQDFELTIGSPYLILTGELWDIFVKISEQIDYVITNCGWE